MTSSIMKVESILLIQSRELEFPEEDILLLLLLLLLLLWLSLLSLLLVKELPPTPKLDSSLALLSLLRLPLE